MIFSKDQKEDISKRIDFMQIQLEDLKNFKAVDWKSYSSNRSLQRDLERLAENVANSAIDICKITLVEAKVEMPNSYKEIILSLGAQNIIPENLAQKISEYARLRNLLAHEYLDLKWEKIKLFLQDAKTDFDEFIRLILAKL